MIFGKKYRHIDSIVDAIQCTPETQAVVIDTISNEGALQLLKFVEVKLTDCSAKLLKYVKFQYKTDCDPTTIVFGDYLVRLNLGTFIVMTEKQFRETYIEESEPPLYHERNILDVVFEEYKKKHPTSYLTKPEQLTDEILTAFMEEYKHWYLPIENICVIQFNDAGLRSVCGLARIANIFCKASFVNQDTKFRLLFTNQTTDPKTNNLFDFIALQGFLGELKDIEPDYRERIYEIDFYGATYSVHSAISDNVDLHQWGFFLMHVGMLTGIENFDAVKRSTCKM